MKFGEKKEPTLPNGPSTSSNAEERQKKIKKKSTLSPLDFCIFSLLGREEWCVCMYACVYVCLYVCMCVCAHGYMCVCMYICVCACIYVSMYVYCRHERFCSGMCVCMYVCVYMIHTYTQIKHPYIHTYLYM